MSGLNFFQNVTYVASGQTDGKRADDGTKQDKATSTPPLMSCKHCYSMGSETPTLTLIAGDPRAYTMPQSVFLKTVNPPKPVSYEQYMSMPRLPNRQLTISPFEQRIISIVNASKVTIVTGPTGCGKTTQVPQYILDWHAERDLYCNILVTQPRRLGAVSIAKRVCTERGWPLGSLCGYKIGLEEAVSEDTRLTYVTVGVFLQMLINQQGVHNYTHVIFDEVHEREQSLDFCLLVMKKMLALDTPHVKLILMSATTDVYKLAVYFEERENGQLKPPSIIHLKPKNKYPVEIFYLEELGTLGMPPEVIHNRPSVSESTINAATKLLLKFDKMEKNTPQKKAVLVFLPGLNEIEEMYNEIVRMKSQGVVKTSVWLPVPLHSSITAEEQAKAFRETPIGVRKIILATNIAESSITVPDVKYVIDFCLTKLVITDSSTNFTSLETCWASKASLTQRAGRVGRVMAGKVYRLIPKNYVEMNLINEADVPDMLRCPLEKVTLQAKILNMGDPKSILQQTIDPPDLSTLGKTILLLKEVGALLLTREGRHFPFDGDLTFLGFLMAALPVDIHLTRLMLLGYAFGVFKECIIIAASMSLKSVFSNPFRDKIKAYAAKLDWANGSASDCISFLNVYEVWKQHQSTGYFKRLPGDQEGKWAKKYFVQVKSLREVEVLVEELTTRLKIYGVVETPPTPTTTWTKAEKEMVIKFAIAGAFYPNYFVRRNSEHLDMESINVKILGGRNPLTTLYFTHFPSNYPLLIFKPLIRQKLYHISGDIRVSSDETSKIFIEFRRDRKEVFNKQGSPDMPFDSTIPGNIPMAMYRTAKMKFINKELELRLMPQEDADEINFQIKRQRREAVIDGSIRREHLFMCTLPGREMVEVPVNITNIVDPSSFWCVRRDEVAIQNERNILFLLNYPYADLVPFKRLPKSGEMCAASKDPTGLMLERGKIIGLYMPDESAAGVYRHFVPPDRSIWFDIDIDSEDEEKKKSDGEDDDEKLQRMEEEMEQKEWIAKVFFIDKGVTKMVSKDRLMRYGADFFEKIGNIPSLAFECCLANLRASPRHDPAELWLPEAVEEFKNITENAELIADVYSVVDGVVSIVLKKIVKTETETIEININDHMVEKDFADRFEECYLSEVDYKRRRRIDFYPEEECHFEWQFKSDWIPSPLRSYFLYTGPYPYNKFPKVKLRGPFSPLEMRLHGVIRGTMGTQINIAQTSVNSVLLDPYPQDKFERLLVAATICQNSNNNDRLILSETTMMPNVRGLSAIVPFVFAPFVELRVNSKKSKYTGILCGLGANSDGDSIFPDHDIEVVFDTDFTPYDVEIVNRLRFYTSMLIMPEHFQGEGMCGSVDRVRYKRVVHECLRVLLFRKRRAKDLEPPKKECKWGLYKPNLTNFEQIAAQYSSLAIFPLIPGMEIEYDPDETSKLKEHLKEMRDVAFNSKDYIDPLTCKLCEISLKDDKDLRVHLSTPKHGENEKELNDRKTY